VSVSKHRSSGTVGQGLDGPFRRPL
jgi:hypothetical protein